MGKILFCVRTPLSSDGEAYVDADAVRVDDTGNLIFFGECPGDGVQYDGTLVASFAFGFWTGFYLVDRETLEPTHISHFPPHASTMAS